MENFSLDHDIEVYCVTADSFPNGVMDAHKKLHAVLPFKEGERKVFGISRPENGGGIVYKAALEALDGDEAKAQGLEKFTIQKGEYAFVIIHDYMKHLQSIGETFQELLKEPQLDPNGYCLEWYLSKEDVRCMVPLK